MTQAIEIIKSDLAQYRELIEKVLTVLEDGDMVTADMLQDWDQDAYGIHHAGLNVKKTVDTDNQLVINVKAHRSLINTILDAIVCGEPSGSTIENWREELLEVAQ